MDISQKICHNNKNNNRILIILIIDLSPNYSNPLKYLRSEVKIMIESNNQIKIAKIKVNKKAVIHPKMSKINKNYSYLILLTLINLKKTMKYKRLSKIMINKTI